MMRFLLLLLYCTNVNHFTQPSWDPKSQKNLCWDLHSRICELRDLPSIFPPFSSLPPGEWPPASYLWGSSEPLAPSPLIGHLFAPAFAASVSALLAPGSQWGQWPARWCSGAGFLGLLFRRLRGFYDGLLSCLLLTRRLYLGDLHLCCLGDSRQKGLGCNSSVRCVQQKLASVSLCPRISLPSAPFQYSDHLSAMKLRAFASHRVLLHMFPLDLQTASDTWPVVPASWFLGSCYCCPQVRTSSVLCNSPVPPPCLMAWLHTALPSPH